MKSSSEFPLHLPDAANEVTQSVHVYMYASGMKFVKTININFTDNLPTFPITKSLWSYLKLLLICLQKLGFGFDQSLSRGKPVGKSPYYRSFDRSANWRVKDSVVRGRSWVAAENGDLWSWAPHTTYYCHYRPVEGYVLALQCQRLKLFHFYRTCIVGRVYERRISYV